MSLTEAETQAAAALTESILGQFAEDGSDRAAELIAQDAPAEPVAAAPVVPSTPAPATPATPAAPPIVEAPSFEAELTDDLRTLLEEPDFDEEAEQEITAEQEDTPDEYLDADTAKKVRSLEKRNAWLEEQVVLKSKRGWVKENLDAYPLLRTYAKAEVEGIKATSRRAFAREAAALNGRLETIAKPMLDDIAKLKAELGGEAKADAEAQVKAAWGNIPGDTASATPADAHASRLAQAEENAKQTGSLKDVFKVMLEQKPLV